MKNVRIGIREEEDLSVFLEMKGFRVSEPAEGVFRIERDEEIPVYISLSGDRLYFETDMGNVESIAEKDLYFRFLDLNTEITPVSLGINSSNPEDPRLVLTESRQIGDLSGSEVLEVLNALELATARVAEILGDYIQKEAK